MRIVLFLMCLCAAAGCGFVGGKSKEKSEATNAVASKPERTQAVEPTKPEKRYPERDKIYSEREINSLYQKYGGMHKREIKDIFGNPWNEVFSNDINRPDTEYWEYKLTWADANQKKTTTIVRFEFYQNKVSYVN